MKLISLKGIALFVTALLMIACGQKENNTTVVKTTSMEEIHQSLPKQENKEVTSNTSYKKGDHVPSDLVCMVNDAYMGGNKQLEVPFEGKMYYGCCQMCQSRIPQDNSVRFALDPFSLKQVDKALAYIVIIGNNGEVAYFENESNYKSLLAQAKEA
ncbi:hypothetical protein NWE55_15155 [Myroides albus]|uniref:MlpB protein n=1 Tax=Myroides albus TaxID=2562892 RepID=A0A6I3LGS6_9FLAO|nr:hypothetical protein [Myroides albus]MTG97413.1 hypothetical protein [Myroides albus]UVD79442.1 hypothetical protein NWE55_15155 [Myroides albus]